MLSFLQKDFHIVTTNYESRSDIIDVNILYKRKTFFINISIMLLINVLLFFIVYNT